jgi:hypothetical protein
MIPQSDPPIPINKAARCQHLTPAGRQCRLLASNARSGLCAQHHAEYCQSTSADLSGPPDERSGRFRSAQGINSLLVDLYCLLAENRVTPRRAAVMAYICSLLLRTLPAMDAGQAARISDAQPAAGNEVALPALHQEALPS